MLRFDDLTRDDPTRIDDQLVVTLDAQLFDGVLQALPYLVDYPYECTEQTLNRFLSTGIVSSLYDDYPAVARMAWQLSERQTQYKTWDAADPNRKMALEETPCPPSPYMTLYLPGSGTTTPSRATPSPCAPSSSSAATTRGVTVSCSGSSSTST